jgi:hypothetical protein
MLTSIYLDYKLMFQTHEIYYVTIYRMLSPEFKPSQITVPQDLPQPQLGIGVGSPQPSGSILSGC